MGSTATIIAIFYLIVVVIGVVALGGIAYSSLVRPRLNVEPEKLAERERFWMVAMLVLLVALLASTIFFTPYGESAGSSGQSVRVTARQFGFVIEPDVVQANVPVAFLMRSDDVNHSFGVYDEDGVLLAQAQIIPGHTQKLVHTFDQPGTYKVLCLEYCGIGHHLMESTFEVKP